MDVLAWQQYAPCTSTHSSTTYYGLRTTYVLRTTRTVRSNELSSAEPQAAGVDGDGYVTSQRRLAASTARRDEMRRRRDTLRAAREEAVDRLRACGPGTSAGADTARVTSALLTARDAALEGSFEQDGLGPGGHWAICEVSAPLRRVLRRALRRVLRRALRRVLSHSLRRASSCTA